MGSSPLARGLRHCSPPLGRRCRIIPARAGFTFLPPRREGKRPDHPRSRGVYRPLSSWSARYMGSSPLARGLRNMIALRGAVVGIIPARAGFTTVIGVARFLVADHPRSRGVYWDRGCRLSIEWGSSPLARGLRSNVSRETFTVGIIPARAGFTHPDSPTHRAQPDHPRSRGVYPPGDDSSIASYGSSPLARGLPMSWSRCL